MHQSNIFSYSWPLLLLVWTEQESYEGTKSNNIVVWFIMWHYMHVYGTLLLETVFLNKSESIDTKWQLFGFV